MSQISGLLLSPDSGREPTATEDSCPLDLTGSLVPSHLENQKGIECRFALHSHPGKGTLGIRLHHNITGAHIRKSPHFRPSCEDGWKQREEPADPHTAGGQAAGRGWGGEALWTSGRGRRETCLTR